MWSRLTTGFRFFIMLVGFSLLVGVVWYVKPELFDFSKNKSGQTKSSTPSKKGGSSMDADLTLDINTWAGFAPIVDLNGGLEPNKNSRMYKEFGIKLRVKINDVFTDSRNNFKLDECNLLYCTTDVLPTEMGAGSGMVESGAKEFLQVDWSRGGDAIVAVKGINTVSDFRGRTVAFAEGTASHSLLIKVLESNGLSMSDIILVKVSDGIEAANFFKAGKVDIAVVWAPDDLDCVDAVKGAKIIINTKTATHIISDGILAKESFIKDNKDLLVKFATAWLIRNGEINRAGIDRSFDNSLDQILESGANKIQMKEQIDALVNSSSNPAVKAAKSFADAFNVDFAFAYSGIKNVRLTTLGDNKDFFGLNPMYQGMTGEQLYTKMSIVYGELNLAKNPIAWRNVSSTSIIESLIISTNQESENVIIFTPVTEEVKSKQAFSNKKVTINFANNSFVLSDAAKTTIDREFVDIAKGFRNARIRIEGNADGVGDPGYNKVLSKKRAQAVANYLMNEHNFPVNRFIVIGNGSEKAIQDGVGEDASYRRTDFQLISEN